MKYRSGKRLGGLRPAIFSLLSGLLLAGTEPLQAQLARPASSCILSGADSVNAGTVATYALDSCKAENWTVSCGAITDQKPGSVTINFAVTNCISLVITATSGGKTVASKKVTVIAAPAITAGVITSADLAVNSGQRPRLLTASPAARGVCGGAYLYQWLSSTDNQTFTPVAGGTGKDLQSGPLTSTTWFKRRARCAVGTDSMMTIPVKITVYPSVVVSRLNPAAQSVNPGDSIAPISLGKPSGGNGKFFYQWQKAASSSFATSVPIGGANMPSYTPVGLNATTYFRVGVISNGDTVYSAPSVASIFPPLSGGIISPASQTILYGGIPSLLSHTGVTGGSGNYRYEWYVSTDGVGWDLLKGVMTPGYNPGSLEATTWFRVTVRCNGQPATSAVAVVNVNSSISGQ
jgi:hypothetical protein